MSHAELMEYWYKLVNRIVRVGTDLHVHEFYTTDFSTIFYYNRLTTIGNPRFLKWVGPPSVTAARAQRVRGINNGPTNDPEDSLCFHSNYYCNNRGRRE
jgi:hypothetical protein